MVCMYVYIYIDIHIYIYYISQLFRCKYASLFLTLFTYCFDCNCGWPFWDFWDSRVQIFSRAFDDCPNENGDMSSIRKTDEWRNTEHCPSQMCIKAPRTYQENERRVWIQLRGITESSVAHVAHQSIFVGVHPSKFQMIFHVRCPTPKSWNHLGNSYLLLGDFPISYRI